MLPVVRPNLTGSLNLNCLGLGCPASPASPLNTSLASSNSEARAAVTSSEANRRPLFILLEMFRFTQLSC